LAWWCHSEVKTSCQHLKQKKKNKNILVTDGVHILFHFILMLQFISIFNYKWNKAQVLYSSQLGAHQQLLDELTLLRKPWHHLTSLIEKQINPLNPELNPIWYLLALLGAHHFLHVSRIRVKLLTFRLLMSIYIWSTHSWCF
jgi:hypothetical protein